MFGNTDDIRDKTENNTNEASWGGFGGRLSYEESQKSGASGKIVRSLPKIALGTAACALLGMLGVFCTVMMYSIFSDNHSLYPEASFAVSNGVDTVPADSSEASIPMSGAQILPDAVLAENVTSEQSRLYRVPMGVLISELDESSRVYSAGFRSGDIIVAIEGEALSSVEALSRVISEEKGNSVEMTLFRNNTYMKIYVTIE